MSGYVPFIAVGNSLRKIQRRKKGVKNNQRGGGSIQVVSPSQRILDQAKQRLKRNLEEVKSSGPGGISVPKKKKTQKGTKGLTKNTSKATSVHQKYKK